jgi:hypothetical protein
MGVAAGCLDHRRTLHRASFPPVACPAWKKHIGKGVIQQKKSILPVFPDAITELNALKKDSQAGADQNFKPGRT